MVAQVRSGSRGQIERSLADWIVQRAPHVEGFVDTGLLFADDGATVVNWARFTTREAYARLGDDPEQDRWYRERIAPLLEGEPRWIDGEYAALPVVTA